jgi:hypothetical protein
MSKYVDTLYASPTRVIQYDRKLTNVIYSQTSSKRYQLIDLKDGLKTIQLYEKSGDLIITCNHGLRRILLAKEKTRLSVKVDPRRTLHLVNHDYLVDDNEPIPYVWRINGSKLRRMNPCGKLISAEYLAPDQFHVYPGKDGHQYLVTNSEKLKISREGFKLLEYDPKVKKESKPVPARQPEKPMLHDSAKNPEGDLMVRFQKDSSSIRIYRVQGEKNTLISEENRHSCGVIQAGFVNATDFISLDSCGKLKIWRIDGDTVCVCQTADPEHFEGMSYYSEFKYDPEARELILIGEKCSDAYELNTAKYKRNKKNELLVFKRTLESPTKKETTQRPEAKTVGRAREVKAPRKPAPPPQPEVGSFVPVKREKEPKKESRAELPPKDPAKVEIEAVPQPQTRPGSRFRRTKARIYVGIDFGTSRTKVSFNNETEGRYEPLNFSKLHPPGSFAEGSFDEFVIPSIACKHQNKVRYGFDALDCGGKLIQNFKQRLMREKLKMSDKLVCAGFLAYVMHAARENIKKQIRASDDDEYIFSVCLPVEQLNNSRKAQIFGDLLRLAQVFFVRGIFADWKAMRATLDDTQLPDAYEEGISCSIIPESIAEILDFCERSAKDKIYVLYDFGAGTTDLTIFFVNTHKGKTDIIDAKIVYKGYSDIDILRSKGETTESDVREHYQRIWKDFHECGIWSRVKDQVRGMESMRYFYDITVFGSGGGFNDPIVREVFNRIPLFHEETKAFIQVQEGIQPLAEPLNWNPGLPPYFRFAVSFGLTKKPEETLSRYVMPKDCKVRDFTPNTRPPKSPDDLYPTPEWLGR